jgi:hypothetical protein
MISPPDPFAQTFDSIKLDAPAKADDAHAEPRGYEEPGFYLLDDAAGRFAIDRETGIVSLAHDHLMALEAGAVHPVHIHVVEPSGSTYELKFRLRMTGRVPQMAGAEENDALAALCAAPLLDLMAPATVEEPIARETVSWAQFAAARENAGRLRSISNKEGGFGALIEPPSFPGYLAGTGRLSLDAAPPAPASTAAHWTI